MSIIGVISVIGMIKKSIIFSIFYYSGSLPFFRYQYIVHEKKIDCNHKKGKQQKHKMIFIFQITSKNPFYNNIIH